RRKIPTCLAAPPISRGGVAQGHLEIQLTDAPSICTNTTDAHHDVYGRRLALDLCWQYGLGGYRASAYLL
ncbi:MAG: hypothetical protein VXU50_00260, partial [Verrucomicrobiota bacterium]|nr:hypothetical protein [Verrucomicrobiota bacterium]